MKNGLSIKAIRRLLSIKKSYVSIAYNGIEKKKNHNFGTCYSLKGYDNQD
jgi:hypothetical protein